MGLVVLAVAWLGPLPDAARAMFSAHMTMHMAVVAVAAPLLALAVTGTRVDPARMMPRLFAPIPASLAELIIVWAWHMPAMHEAARHGQWPLVAEQASFIAAGLFLWISALGGDLDDRRSRAGAGVAGLLFTSMHMTLLGALFALAPRSLYSHGVVGDQQLGGAIMLLVGGASYLIGGLWLTGRMLGLRDLEERRRT